MPDEADTLPIRTLLRCSGCDLLWTASTLEPAPCPMCGQRTGITIVRRFEQKVNTGGEPARSCTDSKEVRHEIHNAHPFPHRDV